MTTPTNLVATPANLVTTPTNLCNTVVKSTVHAVEKRFLGRIRTHDPLFTNWVQIILLLKIAVFHDLAQRIVHALHIQESPPSHCALQACSRLSLLIRNTTVSDSRCDCITVRVRSFACWMTVAVDTHREVIVTHSSLPLL